MIDWIVFGMSYRWTHAFFFAQQTLRLPQCRQQNMADLTMCASSLTRDFTSKVMGLQTGIELAELAINLS